MRAPWVRPVWMTAVAGALVAGGVGAWVARSAWSTVGRTDADTGALPQSLRTLARLRVEQLATDFERRVASMEGPLTELLEHAQRTTARADEPLAALPGACRVALPQGALRAGVVQLEPRRTRALLNVSARGCEDVWAALAARSVDGPPFPSLAEVGRAATQASLGAEVAAERTAVLSAWRVGHRVVARVGRALHGHVAWVDVAVESGAPAGTGDAVALDGWWTLGNAQLGYVLGGPQADALPDALAGVKDGSVRALDLPDLARAAAAPGGLAASDPRLDDGTRAWGLATRAVTPAAVPLAWNVVASVPAPGASMAWRARAGAGVLVGVATWLLVCLLLWRPLARRLGALALATQQAWLGLREDDVGTPEDAERARGWLRALGVHVEALLVGAFGKGQRFWAPSPMERLMNLTDARLKEPTRKDPPRAPE